MLNNGFYSDVFQQHWFYWWRAVSSTYYVRPNAFTIKAMEQYRTLPIAMHTNDDTSAENKKTIFPAENNGKCISIYVRGGDKAGEMELVPFHRYTEAVGVIMKHFLNTTEPRVQGTKGNPVIFLGTESPSVINKALAWGKANNFQVTS